MRRGRRAYHSLHKLAPYVGSFPPRLVASLIDEFSSPGDVVLDPFSGSGTCPLEACLKGRVGLGSDVFIYAYVLTRAKVRPVGLDAIRRLASRLKEQMDLSSADTDRWPELKAIYSENTLKQIIAVRELLLEMETDEANFFKALVCGVLHGPSSMFLSVPMKDVTSMSPRYVERFAREKGLEKPDRDLFKCVFRKAQLALKDGLPPVRGEAFRADARQLPLPDRSVDLIITSPPYPGVLDYAWANWIRVWFLGSTVQEERARLLLTSSLSRYLAFMEEALQEAYRVLRPGGHCVLVVGDVRRRGKVINTAEFLAEVAEGVGFQVREVREDPYPLRKRSFLVLNEAKYGFRADEEVERCSVPMDRHLILVRLATAG